MMSDQQALGAVPQDRHLVIARRQHYCQHKAIDLFKELILKWTAGKISPLDEQTLVKMYMSCCDFKLDLHSPSTSTAGKTAPLLLNRKNSISVSQQSLEVGSLDSNNLDGSWDLMLDHPTNKKYVTHNDSWFDDPLKQIEYFVQLITYQEDDGFHNANLLIIASEEAP